MLSENSDFRHITNDSTDTNQVSVDDDALRCVAKIPGTAIREPFNIGRLCTIDLISFKRVVMAVLSYGVCGLGHLHGVPHVTPEIV